MTPTRSALLLLVTGLVTVIACALDPAMMAAGVARPMAHGQEINSTETAVTKAKLSDGSGPHRLQIRHCFSESDFLYRSWSRCGSEPSLSTG